MKSLKRSAASFAIVTLVATGGAIGVASTANAAQTLFGDKNCYNYNVMLWGTSTGNTVHDHVPSGGGLTEYTWTTAGYHLSAVYPHVSVQSITGSTISRPGRGCDS